MLSNRKFAVGISVRARKSSENCALHGCYAASGGNFVPTFQDNLPARSSGIKQPKSATESSGF